MKPLKNFKLDIIIYSQIRYVVLFKNHLRLLLHFCYPIVKKTEMLIMCVNEILTNIVEHGHKNKKNDIINIKIINKNSEFKLIITETGKKYNINTKFNSAQYYYTGSGAGLYIAKNIVDEFDYSHKDGKNIIELLIDLKSIN